MIKSQEQSHELHESFHSQLEKADDGFSVVAEYFGRGVFNNVTLVNSDGALPLQKTPVKSGNFSVFIYLETTLDLLNFIKIHVLFVAFTKSNELIPPPKKESAESVSTSRRSPTYDLVINNPPVASTRVSPSMNTSRGNISDRLDANLAKSTEDSFKTR